jgi:hypothetical protein
MAAATERMRVRDFVKPAENFVKIPIDITQGCVATNSTPSEFVRYVEFVPGTEPTRRCDETEYGASEVPSVIGMSSEIAFETLEEAGFTVAQSVQVNPYYPSNTVLEQYPEAGTIAEAGDTITILVST